MESILNTASEGNITMTLVVNATGGPMKAKHGIFLCRLIDYDGHALLEPLVISYVCIATTKQSSDISKPPPAPPPDSLVKVADYLVLG